MRKFLLTLLMLVVSIIVLAATAQAQSLKTLASDTNPWYSIDNLSISTGVNYQWWKTADGTPRLNVPKEWSVGVYNAWTLTQHVDAIGTIEYGTDTKIWGFKLGARWVLKEPK